MPCRETDETRSEETITRRQAFCNARPDTGASRRNATPVRLGQIPLPGMPSRLPVWLRIQRSLPDTHAVCYRPATWLSLADYLLEAQGRRADFRANVARVCQYLVTRTTLHMVTMPSRGTSWADTAEAVGVSVRTVARVIGWLRDAGLLHVLVTGSTETTRGEHDGGNQAAEYVLVAPVALAEELEADLGVWRGGEPEPDEVPWPVETAEGTVESSQLNTLVDVSGTPKVFTSLSEKTSPSRRERGETSAPDTTPRVVDQRGRAVDLELYRLAKRLRDDDLTLRQVPLGHLVAELAPLHEHGVTFGDVKHMVNFRPGYEAYLHTDPVRHPRGWLRHRLGAWLDGRALRAPLPSHRRAA